VHPCIVGYDTVLLFYVFITTTIILSLQKDQADKPTDGVERVQELPMFNIKRWFMLCGSLLARSVLINQLPQIVPELFTGMIFVSCSGIGILLLLKNIHSLFFKYI